MHKSSYSKWIERGLWLVVTLALVATPGLGARPAAALHTPPAASGLWCTTGAPSTPTFMLTAKTGYISTGDGNTIFMWGYANADDEFQYPGPVLCVNEGDTVTVVLKNNLPVDTSLVFPGQDNVLANGVPSQPDLNADTLAPVAPANGGTMTYSFVASRAGTFYYQSGTNPAVQQDMGLFGALVVHSASDYVDGNNVLHRYAYNDTATEYNPKTEYLVLLSTLDPTLHMALERNETYNMANYKVRYWLLNGRTFPDTLAPNGASWLPSQPYGALTHIHPYDAVQWMDAPTNTVPNPGYNPLPALQRYVGIGAEDFPFHPHGNSGNVIGRDGYSLVNGPVDLSIEKFTVHVAPGQTWDVTFTWRDAEQYDEVSKPIPVDVPSEVNMQIGAWFGSPYLGSGAQGLPVGTTSFNQCGEYYHIAHSHNLAQITGWNALMVGLITFTRIDPPLGPNNLCPPVP